MVNRCSQPGTLAEAHDILSQMLDSGFLTEIRSRPEPEAVALSRSLGPVLRNLWGLWNGSPLHEHLQALGLSHPDDMSELIFVTFWRHLKGEPLRVEEEVGRLRATSAMGPWKPDPRCKCLLMGGCSSAVLTDPRHVGNRALWLTDCCCLMIPQVVEGTLEGGVLVLPRAMTFRDVACGPGSGAAN
jgi:hypothetical protein